MHGPDIARPSAETVEVLRRASSASVTTILQRRGVLKAWMPLMPLVPGMKVVGPAVTVRIVPGREDLQPISNDPGSPFAHHPDDGIESLQPGDVLVHDGLGLTTECLFGDMLSRRIKAKGGAGLITDMAVRDAIHIEEVGLPVFCKGKASPGSLVFNVDVNVPIACAGALVCPGDIVVGDDDGVVVIPRSLLEYVVEEVLYHEEREVYLRKLLAEGAPLKGTYPPSAETDRKFREWRAQQRKQVP